MDDTKLQDSQLLLEFKYRQELLSHPFFKKINYWMEFQIHNLNIEDDVKRNMVSAFLNIYINKFSSMLKAFLDEGYHVDVKKFPSIFDSILDNIYEESIQQGIPDIFLDKFNELQKSHIQTIKDSINSILVSNLYNNDTNRINAILDIFLYYFIFVTLTIESTVNTMNGNLKKALKTSKFNI